MLTSGSYFHCPRVATIHALSHGNVAVTESHRLCSERLGTASFDRACPELVEGLRTGFPVKTGAHDRSLRRWWWGRRDRKTPCRTARCALEAACGDPEQRGRRWQCCGRRNDRERADRLYGALRIG